MNFCTIISATLLLLGCFSAGSPGNYVNQLTKNHKALEEASLNGHLEIVKELLLWPGVDPTANENAAIRMASRNGHLQVIKELLSRPGVDPTAMNNEAIRWASANGHLEVVKYLLSLGSVDPTSNGNEAIQIASEYGHLEVVKHLLSLDSVDPTANNNEAILLASENGHLEIVKELLSSTKVDPSVLKSQVFKLAVNYNQFDVVKLLIKDGRVDPTIDNLAVFMEAKQRSQNPFLDSAYRKSISDMVSFLEQDEMVSSILFLQSQQELTPTRFLEMINFERAWIHDSYIESILKSPQVSELLSGILGIDRAAVEEITTLKRLNEEMVHLMKSLEEDMSMKEPRSLVSKKRWDFLWRYFGALREYSEEKVALRRKLGFLQRSMPGNNASPSGDNASRFNHLTVWKLQNMIALPEAELLEPSSKKPLLAKSFSR